MKPDGARPLGIYIHVPFCVKKCGYCDFLSFAGKSRDDHRRYLDELAREIGWWRKTPDTPLGDRDGWTVDTIFFGGGTPSLLFPRDIERILGELHRTFRVDPEAEISIEANPATIGRASAAGYRAVGVNRVSLGAQSLSDSLLETLGRIHRAADVEQSVCDLRTAGFSNINLDLIFGIPGQTEAHWEETLDRVFALSPAHVSFYSLEIEQGTPFAAMRDAGRLTGADPGLDRRMYHRAVERLDSAGYEVYEISNAARPGRACRHNLKYWTLEDYLGLGLGAHSFLRNVRFANTGDEAVYRAKTAVAQSGAEITGTARSAAGSPALPPWVAEGGEQSEEETQSDCLFTELRLTRGLDREAFRQRFGAFPEDLKGEAIRRQVARDLLEYGENGRFLRLTALGRDLMNRVLADLLA